MSIVFDEIYETGKNRQYQDHDAGYGLLQLKLANRSSKVRKKKDTTKAQKIRLMCYITEVYKYE
jgi:hypothetical protein